MNGNAHRKWEMGSHLDLPAAPVEEELELRKEMGFKQNGEAEDMNSERRSKGDERQCASEMGNGWDLTWICRLWARGCGWKADGGVAVPERASV